MALIDHFRTYRRGARIGGLALLAATAACQSSGPASPLPQAPVPLYTPKLAASIPARLKKVGHMDFASIDESSGLAASRRWPGILWTHNDSGDTARIFAVRADGTLLGPGWMDDGHYAGVQIPNALNVDWEDIACSPDGTLYIGDFGNNGNARRDLGVYILPEPDPQQAVKARALGFVGFVYPDQDAFPPRHRNFDAEALFYADGTLYLLTKHRSDSMTKLYRFPALTPGTTQTLELIAVLNIRGQVTGADASDDGRQLAILTYGAVWLFEAAEPGRWLDGRASWLPFWNGKISEGICFFEGGLMISNENRELFRVELGELRPVPTIQKLLYQDPGSADTALAGAAASDTSTP